MCGHSRNGWPFQPFNSFRTRPDTVSYLRSVVSRSHPPFAPLAAECIGRGPGVGHPVLPPGLAEKAKGPPRFLGNPRERALFSDPGGIACARPSRRRDAAFRSVNNVGSRRLYSSRGSIARPAHWLSTLRSPGRPGTTQDSLPAAGQALPDGDWCPAGFQRKVSALQCIPLSQAFLAHERLVYSRADTSTP